VPQPAARNAFARANAQKLLALPLYALGVAASFIVKRRENLWVFGCGTGIGEGALPLFELAQAPGRTTIWLAKNDRELADAAARGIRAVRKLSLRGFVATLRAGVIVVTHGLGDANRYATRGAFVVQLWHGIPLKLINLDSPVTTSSSSGALSRLLGRMYRLAASTISFMPAASEVSAVRLRSAFGLPADRVVVTGDPRDDIVVSSTTEQARNLLFAALRRADEGQRVLLYAPTWRDGAADPGVPNAAEWTRIGAWLAATDSLLVVRPHPLSVGAYETTTPRVVLLPGSVQGDITPVLPGVDVLLTDYSSIAYDFSLTGRPIAFLAPDLESYEESRGLYEPYSVFSGGREARSWGELLDLLEPEDKWEALAAHSVSLATHHHAFRDGANTARVYAEISSRLKVPPMTSTLPVGAPMTAVTVDSVTLATEPAPALVVSGLRSAGTPTELALTGTRLSLPASIATTTSRWTATIPLLVSRWQGPALPPPSGTYVLGATLDASLPAAALLPALFRIAFRPADATTLAVTISAPLTDAELGPAAQARLEAAYRASTDGPVDAVFFESFYGQNASCNPRAIDRAIAELSPATARYWSTVDASVEVPDGATRLVEGSEDWWRIRSTARLLVVNDWLRKRYKKRGFQKVLQTWHGTPLKKIALSRPKVGLRTRIATLLESKRWDILLAQNQHSATILRKAYAFLGPVWQEGYPRDDVLIAGDAAPIRARLGITDDVTVLLYAPTWRDDRPEHIDHLDVAAFTDALGPGYLTLIRGHSRTLRPGRDVQASNVLDVTGYPDVSDLFLVADALITDYSSVMFDFSVTGKPVFFFAPDLEHYREQLRGFYFDLDAIALGPVVQNADSLVTLVQDRENVREAYATKYAAWQERFNPKDDGQAAQRIVERLLREKLL
jgi:CDP-glycerol glycerophosphotransferase (TagB/SpsB family)